MKFAVAIVCLLMLNILVSVSGNCTLSPYLFTGSIIHQPRRYLSFFSFPFSLSIHFLPWRDLRRRTMSSW